VTEPAVRLAEPGDGPAVRLAEPGDGPAVLALRRAWSAEWHGPVLEDGFDARFAQWWAGERSGRLTWLAWASDGVPVGMVNLIVSERMPWPGQPQSRWGHLSNAYVLPSHRSHGLGTALVTALLTHARSAGFARIVLSPSERSIPFYRRAGFGSATSLLVLPLSP
jgi:GNAT superfamily N-acetyltransferase